MKRPLVSLACLALAAGASAGTCRAQTSATRIVTLEEVSPATLQGGYRASKILGASVINSENKTVGTVDDLIVAPTGTTAFAVLSVGGFLGIGESLVVVPANAFERKDGALLLRGATRENLKRLPPFTYSY